LFQTMTCRLDQILYKKEKSLGERILLSPLLLASWPYAWAVRVRASLYSSGLLKTKQLPWPVISVGNITVGGTGKTPLVMSLSRGLMEKGIPTAILSRGYRGKKGSGPLVSDGQKILLSPEEAGDEPFFMAQSLSGIPILIGKDRFKNGQVALRQFQVRGFLLDDGFQHLPLYRDLNIVLIDSDIGFGDGHLLPRGILREPLSHIKRADVFLLTKAEDLGGCQSLESTLREIHPSSLIFHSHYEPTGLIHPDGKFEPSHLLKKKRVLALSGIANPTYFHSLLRKCEMEVVGEMAFPDHHLYTVQDLISIKEKVTEVNSVVTTEKDMVKLSRLSLDPLPLLALRIEMKIREEEAFYKRVMDVFKL
ncbi:MAG: tetraacyldisaccharide 4'-kinase, partial [Deltaproteobacteria bacterium]|nr:tetraacyldisaccharide 4'-kinase [Deltaproteobacteria bacterium]